MLEDAGVCPQKRRERIKLLPVTDEGVELPESQVVDVEEAPASSSVVLEKVSAEDTSPEKVRLASLFLQPLNVCYECVLTVENTPKNYRFYGSYGATKSGPSEGPCEQRTFACCTRSQRKMRLKHP